MYAYPKEPLRLKELFINGWVLFLKTYRFSWMWAFLNAVLFLVGDYFTVARISNLIPHLPFLVNLIILAVIFFIPWSFLRSIILAHIHYYAIDEKRAYYKAFIVSLKKWFPVTVASLIYHTITLLGLFLFLIPGIYIGILLFMYLPLLVLQNESLYQSFVKSIKLILGSWWETFFLMLLPSGLIYLIREAMRQFYPELTILSLCVILLSIIIPYSYSLFLIQFNNLKIKQSLANIPTTMGHSQKELYFE